MYFQMFPDNAVKREMSILAVQCINPGCPWVGKFRHYEVSSLGIHLQTLAIQRIDKAHLACADLESFVRGGPNLITFFFFF